MKWIVSSLILSVAAIFLFCRLGHYALWDDEAMVGLIAKGVLKTGDTSAIIDHNIVAYQDGLLLANFRDRSTPPFPAYVTAAAFGLFGQEAWVARLPFALFGLFSVFLILYWALRKNVTPCDLVLLGIVLLGNVSLFLFCRQCRYYSPAIFSSIAIAYFYLHWEGQRRKLGAMVLCSLVLLASNYMEFIALYVCLAVDYFVWKRKTKSLKPSDWLLLIVPQIVVGGLIVLTWNSMGTGSKSNFLASGLAERLKFIAWFLRDLNASEFGVVLLLAVSPLLYFRKEEIWLVRIPVALMVYVISIAFLCPLKSETHAEVRYLAPTIPLWIAFGFFAVRAMVAPKQWVAIPIGILFFWTNLVNLNWLMPAADFKTDLRSTVAMYIGELITPPSDPFSVTSNWINANLRSEQSIWVVPNYAAYPLMFHAPKATYAWQFSYPPKEAFKKLPRIHFIGQQEPDYIIAFAEAIQWVPEVLDDMRRRGISYRELPSLDCYGKDVYRPELILRAFKPPKNFDRRTEGIYIFQRQRSRFN